jgi:hypothetical protein
MMLSHHFSVRYFRAPTQEQYPSEVKYVELDGRFACRQFAISSYATLVAPYDIPYVTTQLPDEQPAWKDLTEISLLEFQKQWEQNAEQRLIAISKGYPSLKNLAYYLKQEEIDSTTITYMEVYDNIVRRMIDLGVNSTQVSPYDISLPIFPFEKETDLGDWTIGTTKQIRISMQEFETIWINYGNPRLMQLSIESV